MHLPLAPFWTNKLPLFTGIKHYYVKSLNLTVLFLKNTSEQHTATDLVNLLYFLRPVSSDHTDLIREFRQDI